jgi:lipopolysaccharide export system protein LptA
MARMVCKFCAAMKPHLVLALLLAAALPAANAEKADRSKPLTIEADQPGTLDLVKQVVVFNGNVLVAQGTMAIRAERVEVRERADGHRSATAVGSGGKPASFKQKRDAVDESIEGVADRIEYDSRGDVVRFVGSAQVRRLRGGAPADEIIGALITYDSGNETFSVQGAPAPVAGAASGNGRIKVTLAPRPEKPDAAASAASAPTR